jgi:hypothetical protein
MPGATTNGSGRRLKQLSFMIPNRLGALQRAIARLAEEHVRICGITMNDAADHAVVRMVVNRPAAARLALESAGFTTHETDLIGVALPQSEEPEVGIRRVLSALLIAELNVVAYAYSLIVQVERHPVLALHVDEPDTAERLLSRLGLRLVAQEEIAWDDASP